MSKYDPLNDYLNKIPVNIEKITLSFRKIEKIIHSPLPSSTINHRPWWANEINGNHVQAHAWLNAGWKVDIVNQSKNWVRFIRA